VGLALQLKRESNLALYQQIAEQIKDQIGDQRLPVGARLPTIRQLAQELGVTRVTVQNAYDELQSNGWIEATIGRGTYVSAKVQPQLALHAFTQQLTPDALISDILQINEVVGVRSMASASPDPQLFPLEEFWQAFDGLRSNAVAFSAYTSSQGVPELRIEIARLLAEQQIALTPDQILITSGVTQSLALVTQALCRSGDVILVEQPTYLGFLHTLKAQGVQPIGVPLDEEGPQLDVLERLVIQQRPRFFYTIPSFQNPTGVNMSLARRQALLALAERHGLLLVEDDIYARLSYEEPPLTSLKALDQAGLVVYVNSFSKTLMPGLRLGFVVAPSALQSRLLSLRRAMDLCSPPLLQFALARFLASGGYKRHLRRVLPIYGERRHALLAALRHQMPPSVTWSKPAGGYCCWLTLPHRHSMANLCQAALRQGWVFTPGDVFLTEASLHHHMRICFGQQSPTVIRHGIEMLSQLIRTQLAQEEHPSPNEGDWAPLV
jgi:DNA-binding transcriptional MocR family regulator